MKIYTERYRSGHNEVVLKTIWGQPHKGSNPFLSANIAVNAAETPQIINWFAVVFIKFQPQDNDYTIQI